MPRKDRGLVAVEADVGQRSLGAFLGRPGQDCLELGVGHAHVGLMPVSWTRR
jgi:hypothetical protein